MKQTVVGDTTYIELEQEDTEKVLRACISDLSPNPKTVLQLDISDTKSRYIRFGKPPAPEPEIEVGDVVNATNCCGESVIECVVLGRGYKRAALNQVDDKSCACVISPDNLTLIRKGPKELVFERIIWKKTAQGVVPHALASENIGRAILDFAKDERCDLILRERPE
jgi:hypothetical protein